MILEYKARLADSNKSLSEEKTASSKERLEIQRLNNEIQKYAAKVDQLEKQMEKELENYNEQLDRNERNMLEQKVDEIDTFKRKHRDEVNDMKSNFEKHLKEYKEASERALHEAHDENETLRSERDKCIGEINHLRQSRKAWENERIAELMQHYTRKHLEANVEFGRDRGNFLKIHFM